MLMNVITTGSTEMGFLFRNRNGYLGVGLFFFENNQIELDGLDYIDCDELHVHEEGPWVVGLYNVLRSPGGPSRGWKDRRLMCVLAAGEDRPGIEAELEGLALLEAL